MLNELPSIVAEYIRAVNAFDTDAILATFAKEALSKNIPREGPLKPQISPLRSSPGFPVENSGVD